MQNSQTSATAPSGHTHYARLVLTEEAPGWDYKYPRYEGYDTRENRQFGGRLPITQESSVSA